MESGPLHWTSPCRRSANFRLSWRSVHGRLIVGVALVGYIRFGRIKHRRLRVGEAIAAPDGTASRILIRDTWNTEIVPELAPEPDDIVLYKHRYSGFYETDLDSVLKRRSIKSLIFTGCTTSVCVESTIRDAMFRDYTSLLLADCTAEPGLADINHDASLLAVQGGFGWVSQSAQFIAALEMKRAPSLA